MFFLFFKQKTAYEMRISDWSSDVCSSDLLSGVVVADLEGRTRTLPAESLLPFFGLSMNLGPIADWGLQLDHHHIAVNPATSETNPAGILAIGDIAPYQGQLTLILPGFPEAGIADTPIRPLIYPAAALPLEYSTNRAIP